jgi:hypothetical protein
MEMGQSRTFRPAVGEPLEDRTVPSGSGGLLGGLIGDVPTQDARQVAQAFGSFERSYVTDVNNSLKTGGTPLATAVGNDLTALNTKIDKIIANLPQSATLAQTIQGELLGTTSSSLQGQLAALQAPTSSSSMQDVRTFLRQSFMDINQTSSTVLGQVRNSPAPSGEITSATVQQVLSGINQAYRTFSQTYNAAISASSTNPATNRAAFDAAVLTGLQKLNSDIDAALSPLPSSVASSLESTIMGDLLTPSGSTSSNSLQAQLAAIKSPGQGFFSTFFFRIQSFFDISRSQGKVSGQVINAVQQFNSSLGGSSMSG